VIFPDVRNAVQYVLRYPDEYRLVGIALRAQGRPHVLGAVPMIDARDLDTLLVWRGMMEGPARESLPSTMLKVRKAIPVPLPPGILMRVAEDVLSLSYKMKRAKRSELPDGCVGAAEFLINEVHRSPIDVAAFFGVTLKALEEAFARWNRAIVKSPDGTSRVMVRLPRLP
jgi:hypothetical protein